MVTVTDLHFLQLTFSFFNNRPQEYKSKHTDIHVELPYKKHSDTHINLGVPSRQYYDTEIDQTERRYRAQFQPTYKEEVNYTVDVPQYSRPQAEADVRVSTTVDAPHFSYTKEKSSHVSGITVDAPRYTLPVPEQVSYPTEITVDAPRTSVNMGYYDDEGRHHSFRHGLHRAADRVVDKVLGHHHHHHHGHHHHHDRVERQDIDIHIGGGAPEYSSAPAPSRSVAASAQYSSSDAGYSYGPSANTVTIPSHHIRLGDLLILQGRPCQVIRITTSAATGQHRYLGVDLFTKQLHEESSSISNPSPSVVVQTMKGPVFKQYRVLDLQDGAVVAMTETGDVKQSLPIIDQSNLRGRLQEAFDTGRGSVRVLVISDQGRELGVDMKVVHGSRL